MAEKRNVPTVPLTMLAADARGVVTVQLPRIEGAQSPTDAVKQRAAAAAEMFTQSEPLVVLRKQIARYDDLLSRRKAKLAEAAAAEGRIAAALRSGDDSMGIAAQRRRDLEEADDAGEHAARLLDSIAAQHQTVLDLWAGFQNQVMAALRAETAERERKALREAALPSAIVAELVSVAGLQALLANDMLARSLLAAPIPKIPRPAAPPAAAPIPADAHEYAHNEAVARGVAELPKCENPKCRGGRASTSRGASGVVEVKCEGCGDPIPIPPGHLFAQRLRPAPA